MALFYPQAAPGEVAALVAAKGGVLVQCAGLLVFLLGRPTFGAEAKTAGGVGRVAYYRVYTAIWHFAQGLQGFAAVYVPLRVIWVGLHHDSMKHGQHRFDFFAQSGYVGV